MLRKYHLMIIVVALMLLAGRVSASPWKASDTKVEVRRDSYNGQHLYITFQEGPVTMMRASLPNDWKIAEAKAIDNGIVLRVEGKSAMCYSSKSFGQVYSKTLVVDKDEDSEKAAIWEKNQVKCE